MKNEVEKFIVDYEKGRITRRELITSLAAITVAVTTGRSIMAAETSTFQADGINHIALNVPDIEVSRDFYVKHLGLKVVREGSSNCFMTCDDNFVALFRSSNAGLNHFCFSVKDYDVGKAEETLTEKGLNPRREGNRIYFNDPHGITVQLASTKHRP